MRRSFVAICLLLAAGLTGLAQVAKSPEAWLTDWSAFAKKLSAQVQKDNYFVDNVNAAFSGKKVTWTGAVTKIEPPAKDGDSGLVSVSMTPEKLGMKSGAPILDHLNLQPGGEEWKAWKSVSVGDTVSFATTLDEGTFAPKCVLSKLDGMGSHTGEVIVWINTRGAAVLKVVPRHSK